MKRLLRGLILLVLALTAILLLPSGRTIEAAPVNPFTGNWTAVSPHSQPNAALSIRGHRSFVTLRLHDPYDFLFCDSTPSSASEAGNIIADDAVGVGYVSGDTLTAVFRYRCSDGKSGFGTATFIWHSVGDSLVDSTGHLWTRI
jgi:hypothetical protein